MPDLRGLSHRDADDVMPRTQVLGVAAHVVGVIAQRRLQSPHEAAGPAVRRPFDIDARESLLAVQHLVAIGSEARLLQSLARVVDRRLLGEHRHDASTRIRE